MNLDTLCLVTVGFSLNVIVGLSLLGNRHSFSLLVIWWRSREYSG